MAAREIKKTARNGFFIPANSTDIAALDAVMLDASDRLATLTKTAIGAARFVGFANAKWSATVANDVYQSEGSNAYATPASFASGAKHQIHVLMDGSVVELSIDSTSGQAGDTVYASTVTTGAMIYSLSNPGAGAGQVAVGHLKNDIPAGASANDYQEVVVAPCMVNTFATDMAFFLANHVEHGLIAAWDSTSLISYTAGGAFVGGKYFKTAYASAALAVGCATHATKARVVLYYVNASGTPAIKDTGGSASGFHFTAAGTTAAAVVKNSNYWPTFSIGDGVIFGGALLRTGSADLSAAHVFAFRRSIQDVSYRKYITGAVGRSGSPTLK